MISAVLIIAFGASSMLQSKASEAATAKKNYAEDVRPPAKSSLVAKRRLTDPSPAATFITPIGLGTAGNFAILTKTGVTTTGVTRVTGNIGVSPIGSTAITGFGLVAHSSNEYATSSLVVGGGKIYAADYLFSTPTMMTTAISDMETAYTAAAGDNGVVAAENLNRAAGHVNGLTLPGGLYKWTTSVTITESLTFDAAHNSSTVWILQIDGSLSLGASALVTLTNGAQPMNIFWQVAGTTNILADAHAEGIILCATAIIFGSGASLTGRALAQTEVTMIATTVTEAEEKKEEL